jgi:hypothetical protein
MTTIVALPSGGDLIPTIGLPVVFDAVLSITHSGSNEPTSYPVEAGADVTDHIRVKPFEVTLSGIMSAVSSVPGEINPFRLADFAGALDKLRESGDTITIVTEHEVWLSMAITNVTRREDVSKGRVFSVDVSARQVRIARAIEVDIPAIARAPSAAAASSESLATAEAAEKAAAAVAAKNAADLASGANIDAQTAAQFNEAMASTLVVQEADTFSATAITEGGGVEGYMAR